ncbi:MAG: hypothetical protein ACI9OJ_006014, partial [Myxococcota bacterium]
PRDPAALPGGIDVAFFVGLNGPTGARVRAFDIFGAPVWSEDIPEATVSAPVVVGAGNDVRLLIVLAGDGLGSLRQLDPETGDTLTDVALELAPTSDAAQIFSGGSHWVIGAGTSLIQFTADASGIALVQTADTSIAAIGSVSTTGDGVIVVAGTLELHRFGVKLASPEAAPVAIGTPIELPGEIGTAVLVTKDCGEVASGGSHWWCPSGVMVAGGENWLRAWKLDDGTALLEDEPEANITGLAMGSDGVIYSGGSHWVEGPGSTWHLFGTLNPSTATTTLASGFLGDTVCPASPIVDTNGDLVMSIGDGSVTRLSTASAGLVTGFARSRGDNLGTGQSADHIAACPGAPVRYYQASIAGTTNIAAASVVSGSKGIVVIGGRATSSDAPSAWIGGIDKGGTLIWQSTALENDPLEPSFRAVAATSQGVVAATVGLPASALLYIFAYGPGGEVLGTNQLEVTESTREQDADTDSDTDGAIVLLDGEESGFQVLWVKPDGEIANDRLYGTAVDGRALANVPGTPDAVVISQSENTFGHVTRVRPDGDVLFSDTFDHGPPPEMLDVFVTPDERSFVLYELESQARVRVYDALGVLQNESVISVVARALVSDAANGVGILTDDFAIQRLNASGEPGVLYELSPGLAVQNAAAAVSVPPAGSILIGSGGATAASSTLYAVRPSSIGTIGCASAGLCIALPDGACEDENECTYGDCDPKTGACSQLNMPDGSACGDQENCNDGLCN